MKCDECEGSDMLVSVFLINLVKCVNLMFMDLYVCGELEVVRFNVNGVK